MSVCTRNSERVHFERTPIERDVFLHQIRREWIATDPRRLRALAALTLHANGWTCDEIGQLLGVQKSVASRLVCLARRSIGNHFEPPVEAPPPAEACVDGDGWDD